MNRDISGFTIEEELIANNIVSVWNGFEKLQQTHPDDLNDFKDALHTLQRIMGTRVLRRDYPDYWLVKR